MTNIVDDTLKPDRPLLILRDTTTGREFKILYKFDRFGYYPSTLAIQSYNMDGEPELGAWCEVEDNMTTQSYNEYLVKLVVSVSATFPKICLK